MQPLPGDGPVLDMLLEPTLIGEDLVAEVAVLLLLGEKEPEEEAIDPAHEARQEGAEGGGRGAHYPAFSECRPRVGPWAEFFAKRGLVLYTHSHLTLRECEHGSTSSSPQLHGRPAVEIPHFTLPFPCE